MKKDYAAKVRGTPGRVVDFKLRPATKEFMVAAESPQLKKEIQQFHGLEPKAGSVDDLLAMMDQHGVAWGAIPGRDVETTWGWKIDNGVVAAIVNAHPTRFVGMGGIDPNKGVLALQEIERIVDLGLCGIALDPLMSGVAIDDPVMWPIYKKAMELKLVVIATGGPGPHIPALIDKAAPIRIDRVAVEFPELRFVMSHGGYPWVTEMITMAARHEHVYYEVSAYERWPGSELYFTAAEGLTRRRMLFASAASYLPMARALEAYTGLSHGAAEAVLRNNAEALLVWD